MNTHVETHTQQVHVQVQHCRYTEPSDWSTDRYSVETLNTVTEENPPHSKSECFQITVQFVIRGLPAWSQPLGSFRPQSIKSVICFMCFPSFAIFFLLMYFNKVKLKKTHNVNLNNFINHDSSQLLFLGEQTSIKNHNRGHLIVNESGPAL